MSAHRQATPFELASPWIFDAEGGYCNVADDRGGETKYGISLRYLRLLRDVDGDGYLDGDLNRDGHVDGDDVRWLTPDQAIAIYRAEYWNAARCSELPAHVALCLFDARVNHRPKSAAMLVQQALRVASDGIVGEKTIAAAWRVPAKHFLPDYLSLRAQLYADIIRSDGSQQKFERGWFRRLFLLQSYVLTAGPAQEGA